MFEVFSAGRTAPVRPVRKKRVQLFLLIGTLVGTLVARGFSLFQLTTAVILYGYICKCSAHFPSGLL
jgi:hypothetical protein